MDVIVSDLGLQLHFKIGHITFAAKITERDLSTHTMDFSPLQNTFFHSINDFWKGLVLDINDFFGKTG